MALIVDLFCMKPWYPSWTICCNRMLKNLWSSADSAFLPYLINSFVILSSPGLFRFLIDWWFLVSWLCNSQNWWLSFSNWGKVFSDGQIIMSVIKTNFCFLFLNINPIVQSPKQSIGNNAMTDIVTEKFV